MTEQKKIYFISWSVVVIVVAILFFFIYFLFSQIQSASFALAKSNQFLASLEEEYKNIGEIKNSYERMKPDLDKINQSLICQEKILDFIVAVEEAAKKSDNKYEIKVIEKAEEKARQDDFDFLVFQVSLRGSFPNLMRFLAYVENLPYLVKPELIQIQRADQALKESELKAGDIITNLHIRLYLTKK